MSHPYSYRYHPPIPTLEIALSAPEGDIAIGPLLAIVDTGADASIIPEEYLTRIGAIIVDEASLRSHWGESRRVHLYQVDLRVDGQPLPDVEAIGDEQDHEILLGRDVLNRFRVLLGGPAEIVKVLDGQTE